MVYLDTIRVLVEYGDWANDRVLAACQPLAADHLDRAFDIGPGSLRRTLLHIWAGESVWLARWMGKAETPWPDEAEAAAPREIRRRLGLVRTDRDRFLASLGDADTTREQVYRDSRGGLFRATLGDMLIQGITHSTHHRAQAVNILRRLGAGTVELDYMMSIRRPA